MLGGLLARFEMGALEYLPLSGELENLVPVHLTLFHKQADTGRRDLVILIQDDCQMILYLVADREEYIDRERKVPKVKFWGRMIPCCLVHYDFTLIRDFLDLFFHPAPAETPSGKQLCHAGVWPQAPDKAGF